MQFWKLPAFGPVGVLGLSLRINQKPPTHSPPFTQQLFLHFPFLISTFRFLDFYITLSLFLHLFYVFLHLAFFNSTFSFLYFYISVSLILHSLSLFLHFAFFILLYSLQWKWIIYQLFIWANCFCISVFVLQTPLELSRPSSLWINQLSAH